MTLRNGAPERLVLAEIAAQPWKNGAGLTRELAVEPRGAGVDDFDWRISIAEVDRDAPFSAFAGIDRCITLLRGAGMRLASADGGVDHRLAQPLTPFAFDGDIALDATLLGGACSDFNVMARRGRWRANVLIQRGAFEVRADPALLLFGIDGLWHAESGATDHDASWPLAGNEALLWREATATLWVTPSYRDATLLMVRLCHDRDR